MVKKKVKKKAKKPVSIFEQDIDPEPFVKGAKAMGNVMAKGAKGLADVVFPSYEAELRRKRKEIDNLEQEIALTRLIRKREKLLKELKEAE